MKQLIALLLVFVMAISLCACGGNSGAGAEATDGSGYDYNLNQETFSVGYSRIDITPELSVPMAGYGNTSNRMSQNIQDYLYATSVAVNDGQGNTVIFVSWDLQRASTSLVETLRPILATETGLPENCFHFTGTHTHSGPDVESSNEASATYVSYLTPRVVQVVMESLEDLKPATMSVGSIEAQGLNFVRHYSHIDENGEKIYFGDNRGTVIIDGTTVHASEADSTMFVVKFDREEAQDVCMINWRAHPHWTGSSSLFNLSSDYVGPFREAFELQTDYLFAYYQGAAGNINEKSRITSENLVSDYKAHGARLSDYAIECLENNMVELETGPIRIQEQTLSLKVNKTDDVGFYYAAQAYRSVYNTTLNKAEAQAAAPGYTFYSQYHAGAVVSNYKKADTEDRTYSVVTIGDQLAISLAPHEMFDSTMQKVEDVSPYKFTLHFSYSNGTNTYMPDAFTWTFGSYETDVSVFVPGSAELVQDAFTEMIAEMHSGS